jgi:hypothetical protein
MSDRRKETLARQPSRKREVLNFLFGFHPIVNHSRRGRARGRAGVATQRDAARASHYGRPAFQLCDRCHADPG